MKVLVVGQGGREHALVWKLAQSPIVEKVWCAPGNAGTALDAENVSIPATDSGRLRTFAKENQVDLTVVGPEAPLVAGLTDEFRSAGLAVFGPSKAAARLEGSKHFCKQIMKKAGVPTADFRSFTRLEEAVTFLESGEDEPIVVKADGLCAGKGVSVCADRAEAVAAVRSMLADDSFGAAGRRVVIEECLQGQEASILCIVDGDTIIPLAASQDHKRAGDGDTGPNTGGMGAYSPAPLVTDSAMDEIIRRVVVPTVHSMKEADCPFSGVLYAGLMMTPQGPKVLEFNVRLGDPETQPVLMRLKSDLAEILYSAALGKLDEIEAPEWDSRASVCVVMASDGYPGEYAKGLQIEGINDADALPDVKVFHAGTQLRDDRVLTNGGRVLGVTALGEDIAAAKARAYSAVDRISWPGGWYRTDISDKA